MCIPIAFKMPKFFTITEYVPNLLSPFAPVSAGLFTNSSRRLYILWKFPIVSIPFRFVLDRCNAILYFTFLRCNHFNWPAYLLSHYFALVFSFFALLCRSVILQCTLYLLDCCAFFSNPMCMHPWKKRILLCIFSFPFVIFLHLQPYKKLCFDLLFLCFFFCKLLHLLTGINVSAMPAHLFYICAVCYCTHVHCKNFAFSCVFPCLCIFWTTYVYYC